MESVVRGLIIYIFLLVIFRIAGKRTLAQSTNFDLVMLLIISETTQQAMVDNDHSIMNAFLLIMTLVGASIGLALLKERFPRFQRAVEGRPVILIENGKVNEKVMAQERVDQDDIMESARELHGLEKYAEIKHAVLERNGSVTIIPKK